MTEACLLLSEEKKKNLVPYVHARERETYKNLADCGTVVLSRLYSAAFEECVHHDAAFELQKGNLLL